MMVCNFPLARAVNGQALRGSFFCNYPTWAILLWSDQEPISHV